MGSDNPTSADNQQETSLSRVQLDPKWIAGFVDGEGCFSVSMHRNRFMHRHRGWQIQTSFHVYQHSDNRDVLEKLRDYFGCGHLRSKGPCSAVMTYCISALRDLDEIVVPFFETHELLVKVDDFAAFSSIVRAMRRREYLTDDGFEWIVRRAYLMNAQGKQRSRTLEEILEGSSETVREAASPNFGGV
jgi:LAGLIDADG endonuclease